MRDSHLSDSEGLFQGFKFEEMVGLLQTANFGLCLRTVLLSAKTKFI